MRAAIGVQVLVLLVHTWRPGFPSTIEKLTVAWSGIVKLAPEESLSVSESLDDTVVGLNW